jgi:hypothetical protein
LRSGKLLALGAAAGVLAGLIFGSLQLALMPGLLLGALAAQEDERILIPAGICLGLATGNPGGGLLIAAMIAAGRRHPVFAAV